MFTIHTLFRLLCISTISKAVLSAEPCSRGSSSQNSVLAWLTESCGGDSPISDSGDIIPSNLPSPLSCPRHPNNSKCYPIWETELSDEEKSESRDPSSLLDYKIQPILRTSSQHPFLGFKVRSVTLSWPDGMKHAIFFTDDSCQELSIRRPDVLWHVERYETQSKQCQSIPEGLFKSIEFMRQDEYEIFMKRMQGKDDGIGGASWRGIF